MTASPLDYTGVSIRSIRKPRRTDDMQRPKKRRAISEIYPRFIDTGMTGPYENPCPAATTEPSANAPPSRPGANYRPRKSALMPQRFPFFTQSINAVQWLRLNCITGPGFFESRTSREAPIAVTSTQLLLKLLFELFRHCALSCPMHSFAPFVTLISSISTD